MTSFRDPSSTPLPFGSPEQAVVTHTPIPPSRPVGKAHLKSSYDKANGVQLQILALQRL